MCGIAGYIRAQRSRVDPALIERLMEPIRGRGPDDEGACFIDRERGNVVPAATDASVEEVTSRLPHFRAEAASLDHDVGFLHTRYAIVDLSPGGHQPFLSSDGRVAAVFNGEIYNYCELRSELESIGAAFRTTSDTEVLVEGYCRWGEELWPRMNGFWAVALFDRRDGSVVLSRDRIGVAPLYFREAGDGLYFASAIGSLLDAQPGLTVDDDVMRGFVETSQKDFDDSTYYREIRSIPPATWVRFASGEWRVEKAKREAFWALPRSRWSAADVSLEDAVQRFRDTFINSVEIRLRADVKVAIELSGGLDSSSIVAVAAGLRSNNISTYTIEVPEQNEEPYARAILERYPVDYRVLRDPEDSFFEEMAGFVGVMEEPFHSPNIYTHYKMRQRMKAQGVSAVLSGSGGDEVVAGYEGEFWRTVAQELLRRGERRHVMTHELARRVGPITSWKHVLPAMGRVADLSRRLVRRAVLGLGTRRRSQTPFVPPARSRASELRAGYPTLSFHEQQRYHFQVGLLPYYLRSNDHFTMAIPLEHRFPFLDYRIVELGLQVPPAYLFKGGWTKYLVREAMRPFLPDKILWRREKMGFPFAYERFFASHRGQLLPYFELGARAVQYPADTSAFDSMSCVDPMRTWRICSTGMWIESSRG
jgi:asparagine synthase (glutamine-hydrolysing)